MASPDSLDTMIDSCAQALGLPLDPAWRAAVRFNLDVSLKQAKLIAEFELPDDAEPAPVFKA